MAFPTIAEALEVTLRLVRADAPTELVSTAITTIDVEAEQSKALADQADAEAIAKIAGRSAGAKDQVVQPKAQFDRYSNYMRGIVVDQKHPFYKSYQGSYLGRSDVIKLDLGDGEHVIDPGGHRFAIAGGAITSSDSSLKINGSTIDILAYPVTIIAVDGSAVRDTPAEVRRLPVAPRLYAGDEELLPKEENLAADATFRRLTLYMLANDQGAGYRVSPSDTHFHVTDQGIVSVDAVGKPINSGASIENRFTLVLPKVAIPVTVYGSQVQVVFTGAAGSMRIDASPDKKLEKKYYMYPAP